ncbi:hypothetical protein GGI20_004494, partial [Coemansia sp. BCRC 34301]
MPDYAKLVEPFIHRAQEMAAVDPVVSYFCKYYAARLAITADATTERDTYLAQLLDQLETEKGRLAENENMRDDRTASQHVTSFALRVFAKADTEDREGRGSKATAKTFIVASQFLQVVGAFGEVPVDLAEKIKYAKWRAAEILKAAREGRPPPEPPVVQESDVLGWPSPPPPLSPPVVQTNVQSFDMLPVASDSPAFIPVPAASLPSMVVTGTSDPDQMLDPAVAKRAQKLARWAISALEYDD